MSGPRAEITSDRSAVTRFDDRKLGCQPDLRQIVAHAPVTAVMARWLDACHRIEVRIGHSMLDQVSFGRDGVRLVWRRRCAEARYCGSVIPWYQVRDGDPDDYVPQVRLRDGRTVFVPSRQREELRTAMDGAGVRVVRRRDPWAELLEPFLDIDYEAVRADCEEHLRSAGFSDAEIAGVRRRVRWRMSALTALSWEWVGYGQYDLLEATASFIRWMPWRRYRYFRAWTDGIADRPTALAA